MSNATPPPPGWWQASDGNWYPPETHPSLQAPASPPPWTPQPEVQAAPAPKKKGHKVLWGSLAGVAVLFVIAAIAGSGSQKNNAQLATKSGAVPTTAAPVTVAPTTAPPTTAAPTTVPPTTAPPTTAAPTTTAPPPKPTTTTAPPQPSLSVSQKNAISSAKSYLSISAFSRSGLIHQLEYEKFSTDDATFAVDSLNVDWNQQAAKSGKQYLSISSFSHGSLVQQLEYEGFTPAQAEFGASANGL